MSLVRGVLDNAAQRTVVGHAGSQGDSPRGVPLASRTLEAINQAKYELSVLCSHVQKIPRDAHGKPSTRSQI